MASPLNLSVPLCSSNSFQNNELNERSVVTTGITGIELQTAESPPHTSRNVGSSSVNVEVTAEGHDHVS